MISEKLTTVDFFAKAVASIFAQSLALFDEGSLCTFSGDKALSAVPKRI
jgi:hypothetical protein